MAQPLPTFQSFDLAPRESTGPRFEKWVKRLENLFAATKTTDKKQKVAMLLHYGGEELHDVYDTLDVSGDDIYTLSVDALKKHFEPSNCVDQHIYMFRKEMQKPEENVSTFYTRLRLLAKKCHYANSDDEIRRQLIQGCRSSRLRRKALEGDFTLDKFLKSAQAMEMADEQVAEFDREQSANFIKGHESTKGKKSQTGRGKVSKNQVPQGKRRETPQFTNKQPKSTQCGLCGGRYPHYKDCPAKGKRCAKCGKLNHFARVCRSEAADRRSGDRRPVLAVEKEPAEANNVNHQETEYVFETEGDKNCITPTFKLDICGSKVVALADSGATVNIMAKATYLSLQKKPTLVKSSVRIFPYASETALNVIGRFAADVECAGVKRNIIFQVVEGKARTLLSWKTSQDLNLIQVANNTVTNQPAENCKAHAGVESCKSEPVHITIDESIPPVAQPHRRIPFHMRKLVENELNELEKADIIEKVEGATPWVSPIVVVPKPNDPDRIRICVDMREANRAICRERHLIPTVEEIALDLNGCTVFSKIDLKQGYHQFVLHPDSRKITTFSTHVGLYRYKRLNFGMSCSAEIFQKRVSDVLSGIPGTRNFSDDIYVGGKDVKEHNERLERVLRRLQENKLTINTAKCQFRVDKILFFGHIFDKKGMSPDPKKVEALVKTETPSNPTEVRSLLSAVAFCSRFIPNFSTITAPLRRLTCKDREWKWSDEEDKALNELKDSLENSKTLGFFDVNKETVLYVDGSPVGVGAVLTQKDEKGDTTPIYYASKSLSPTQSRYSQLEREALAVFWAIRRFDLYLRGKSFIVVTDHKPLLPMFNNPTSKPPARIEKWILNLQQYRFQIQYEPGKNNPADFPSRHPEKEGGQRVEEDSDHYIAFITHHDVPRAMTITEVEAASEDDPILKAVRYATETGKWYEVINDNSDLSKYHAVRNELTVSGSLVLKGRRVVIPKNLQHRVVDIAHESHQGLVKTKALLREKVWFPSIDKVVEMKVKSCLPCASVTPVTTREPLIMTPLPQGPFQEISIDFATFSDTTILVIVDDYSRYPFAEIVSSTSASATIPRLHALFALFGTPVVVKSDNGPPFQSEEFARFASVFGFTHRRVTPLWPRANGEVERFVQTLKKAIKCAQIEGRNWRKEMQQFLASYRTTPHCTTGESPSSLFLKRTVKTKLPSLEERDKEYSRIQEKDEKQKSKMKEYADQKGYVKPIQIEVGETVLVKKPPHLKKTSAYEETPMKVVKKIGTMITASSGEKTVTRNASFFKPFLGNIPEPTRKTTLENPISGNDNDESNMGQEVESEAGIKEKPQEPVKSPTENHVIRTSSGRISKPTVFKDFVYY